MDDFTRGFVFANLTAWHDFEIFRHKVVIFIKQLQLRFLILKLRIVKWAIRRLGRKGR